MRRATLLLLALVPLAGCGGDEAPAAPFPRANVLLVTLDTVRADRLGCYGYDRPTSPHLDALAARSVLFERAFANSSFTPPSFRPSTACATGRGPWPTCPPPPTPSPPPATARWP
jgi:hypothetical protein